MTLQGFFFRPSISKGLFSVWRRNFLEYRKSWFAQVLWTFLEPLLYLGAIGYGLGAYVGGIAGSSYVEFLFPGLLASTAMTVAFFDGTYGNFGKLTAQSTYATMLLTRLSPEDIVMGEILWGACKSFVALLGIVAIGSLMGLGESWRILPALGVLFLLSWLFAALAALLITWARTYDTFIYWVSGFIVPMSLISGVYFPMEQLPRALQIVLWILPLPHGVALTRGILEGNPHWSWVMHFGYLMILSGLLTLGAMGRLRSRLIR